MDWADELAASVEGPQVVNDSKTPSGTVHVGSLRGPVILDVITRRCAHAASRPRCSTAWTTWTPWTPRRCSRPTRSSARWAAARPRPRPRRRLSRELRAPLRGHLHRHLRRARHPPGPLLLDQRHLPHGADGPVHPHRAGPRRRRPGRLPPRGQRPAPGPLAAAGRGVPVVRQDRDHHRVRLGRRDRRGPLPAGPRGVGRGLRVAGPRDAVRRDGQAAVEPGVGRPVDAVRRHDRAQRQGPGDGRRLPRPLQRDRARGLRPRAASELPVRVPQHRRQEDVHVQGPRSRRAHHRRRGPAGAGPVPVRPPAAGDGPGLRSRGHRRRPAPVRRVRPPGGRDGGPRGQGRAPARATSPSSGTRSWIPKRTSPPPRPRSGLPSATWRCWSRSRGWTWWSA